MSHSSSSSSGLAAEVVAEPLNGLAPTHVQV